jgi:site-specific recombinase XerD
VAAAYAKNGTSRTVSLNSVVLAALNQLPRISDFVFAKPNGTPYHAIRGFRGACQRAGLTGVTPHSTRHTFATRLCENGVDLRLVQELGGWATLALVQRYTHVSPWRATTLFTTPEKQQIAQLA